MRRVSRTITAAASTVANIVLSPNLTAPQLGSVDVDDEAAAAAVTIADTVGANVVITAVGAAASVAVAETAAQTATIAAPAAGGVVVSDGS